MKKPIHSLGIHSSSILLFFICSSTEKLMLLNCCVGKDSWEPLDCKEIQPVNHKGNQSWIFIGRNDLEAETPILWPPDVKNQLIWKDPDAGKDWGLEEKGTTEDEMVGWHHWLDGREFEWTPGVGDGQGGWCAAVHGVAKSQTLLSNWTELFAAVNLPHWIYDADDWALSHKLERQALLVSTNRPLFSINSLFKKHVTCIGCQWIHSPLTLQGE